jgi:hypothetical protein
MMDIGFIILEVAIFLIVALFEYVAYSAVTISIDKYGTSPIMYFPLVLVALIFPILLYKYKQMFSTGKFLVSFVWLMGTSSFIITMLYFYIPSLV